jgi:hypothetical protein
MKLFLIRVELPAVYTVASATRKEAIQKAAERFKREFGHPWLEPEAQIISEEEIGLGFWDSVDAAIDDAKERLG